MRISDKSNLLIAEASPGSIPYIVFKTLYIFSVIGIERLSFTTCAKISPNSVFRAWILFVLPTFTGVSGRVDAVVNPSVVYLVSNSFLCL